MTRPHSPTPPRQSIRGSTAIRQQLGFRLTPIKECTPVIVIDRVIEPTAN